MDPTDDLKPYLSGSGALNSTDLLKVLLKSCSSVSIEFRTFDSSIDRLALTFLIVSCISLICSKLCSADSSSLSPRKRPTGISLAPLATLTIYSLDSLMSNSCCFCLISCSFIICCCLRLIDWRLSCRAEYWFISLFSFSASSCFFISCWRSCSVIS